MEQLIEVGNWTNQGRVLFIDTKSSLIPDPICKVSATMKCSHRLSELFLVEEPQSEIDKALKIKELMNEKFKTIKTLNRIEFELSRLM